MRRIINKSIKKNTVIIAAAVTMIVGMCTGCGDNKKVEDAVPDKISDEAVMEPSKTEVVTYEFETFDNLKVVLDESNIIAQESSDDPENSELISAEAVGNIIAPGRDYVYLEDANNYYVADYSRNLITVADKSKVQAATETGETEGVGDIIEETDYAVFDNDVFTFRYDPEYFAVMEDEKYVTVSFYNEETQTAGSNTVTFTQKEGADALEVAKEYARQYGVDEENVHETTLGITSAAAYSFSVSPTDEAASGNKTRAMVCAVANGDKVIAIEVFTHVEPDEGRDMFINDKIAEVLDTFAIN